MKPYSYHPLAEAELIEAAEWYEDRSEGLGDRFLDEVARCIDEVRGDPERFPVVRKNVRRKSLRRFPYNLLFIIEPTSVRFVAVMHQKRRPGYWLGRLR